MNLTNQSDHGCGLCLSRVSCIAQLTPDSIPRPQTALGQAAALGPRLTRPCNVVLTAFPVVGRRFLQCWLPCGEPTGIMLRVPPLVYVDIVRVGLGACGVCLVRDISPTQCLLHSFKSQACVREG